MRFGGRGGENTLVFPKEKLIQKGKVSSRDLGADTAGI